MSSRIEATIPDQRADQVRELEEELGLTKSQLVDEALALFAKAVLETKRGRHMGFVGPDQRVVEFSSPALSLVAWAAEKQPITLKAAAFDRVRALNEKPPRPTQALRKAMGRRRARRA